MKVQLSDYQHEWPDLFEREKSVLLDKIGPWLQGPIEHVGSTAVPGLKAKPIIDIMAGVKNLDSSVKAIEVLQNNGYCYYPYKADVMHWFCKPTPEYRTHHLHLVPYDSPLWRERIKFRDILRNNAKVAEKYEQLKVSLARDLTDDRESYTEPFIESVLREFGC
ncbi:GrpB family protein [Pseudohongiella spirulinae]|uniref:Glutamate-rich protein n=1 Tax=Pseudohongiella spirulinae TaxID=1249552 RepID=A0A0S2K9A8_9GAMM|nr:GrpB family protein [Pseudohongiella spirulinae]ALO44919.1 Glutamate-rich protein [Pseudohongiella spirulinae]